MCKAALKIYDLDWTYFNLSIDKVIYQTLQLTKVKATVKGSVHVKTGLNNCFSENRA